MSGTANAPTAGIRGPKSVNNLAQCTNGIVQASTKGQQAMQRLTHGISGISVGTNRRSYRGPSNRRGVSVFHWLAHSHQARPIGIDGRAKSIAASSPT
jgi:hypothetical protein